MIRVFGALVAAVLLTTGPLPLVFSEESADAEAPAVTLIEFEDSKAAETDPTLRVFAVDVPELKVEKENYLGVVTAPVPDVVAAQILGLLEEHQGLIVKRVLPDSPAKEAGLKRHDILATYAGKKLTSSEQLKKLISGDETGSEVALGIVRAGKAQEIKVTLRQRHVSRVSRARKLLITYKLGSLHPVPALDVDLEGKGAVVDNEEVVVAVVGVEESVKENEKGRPAPSGRLRELTLKNLADERVKLLLVYTNDEGETAERSFEGTRREVRHQLRGLPRDVRNAANRHLHDSRRPRNAKPMRFRLHLQPSLRRSGEGSLQIHIVRPGKDGEVRVFNLEGFLAPKPGGGVRGNLDLEVLREELGKLEPRVRVHVQDALDRIGIPTVEVEVEISQ